MEAEALVDALAYTLGEMEPETFGNTVADVERIDYTIRQLKANTLFDTLGDVPTEPLVDTLA